MTKSLHGGSAGGRRIRFTKMHGLGNDYVFVSLFDQELAEPESLARSVSDRHFGVGGDGLILIAPPLDPSNHCRMIMFNADGSRAQMCGNGIRCVARYAYERGTAGDRRVRVETDAGVKDTEVLLGPRGRVEGVAVDMGAPRLRRREIPLADGGDPEGEVIGSPLDLEGRRFFVTAVSMGNPHAVVRVDDPRGTGVRSLDDVPIELWGPAFERHPWFPERVNTEFVIVRSRAEIDVRVWERGSGETLACGTGACAAVVAAVLQDWCDPDVRVRLRGGELSVRWGGRGREGSVLMSGPAEEVFEGAFERP
jgi:diaminopimelate epimerase